jgi:hypothetical protein
MRAVQHGHAMSRAQGPRLRHAFAQAQLLQLNSQISQACGVHGMVHRGGHPPRVVAH